MQCPIPHFLCCLPFLSMEVCSAFVSKRAVPLYLQEECALRGHRSLDSVLKKCTLTILAKAPSGFHLWKKDFAVLLRKKRDVEKWNKNNEIRIMKI